jgi:hypothetical protein
MVRFTLGEPMVRGEGWRVSRIGLPWWIMVTQFPFIPSWLILFMYGRVTKNCCYERVVEGVVVGFWLGMGDLSGNNFLFFLILKLFILVVCCRQSRTCDEWCKFSTRCEGVSSFSYVLCHIYIIYYNIHIYDIIQLLIKDGFYFLIAHNFITIFVIGQSKSFFFFLTSKKKIKNQKPH